MAKAFTQSDKDQIRHSLLQKGREYFIKYSLKKTSVDELAKAVGIAKGSFYKFFDSKEALFMAIHEESEEKFRTDLMQKLNETKEPVDKLRLFFKSSFLILEEDPLLRVVFGKGEYENLSGLITSEQYQEHYSHNIVFMGELIRQWQEQGIVKQIDAEVASNLIASVFFIYLQKETIGEKMYARVTDMMVECLVNYLSGERKSVGSQ
jgi:AcrR family transcriptional regulator